MTSKPTPKVPTGEAKNQNEHKERIIRDQGLSPPAKLVAIVIAHKIGKTHRKRFNQPIADVEYAISSLVEDTGYGDSTVKKAAKEVVEQGYFLRTDNGKGGRNNANPARFRASVPLSATEAGEQGTREPQPDQTAERPTEARAKPHDRDDGPSAHIWYVSPDDEPRLQGVNM